MGMFQAGWEVRRTSGSQVYFMDISKATPTSLHFLCSETLPSLLGTGHTQWEDPRLQIPVSQSRGDGSVG